jgi:hypothetical protein
VNAQLYGELIFFDIYIYFINYINSLGKNASFEKINVKLNRKTFIHDAKYGYDGVMRMQKTLFDFIEDDPSINLIKE